MKYSTFDLYKYSVSVITIKIKSWYFSGCFNLSIRNTDKRNNLCYKNIKYG